jgi:hypothetical protein
MGPQKISQMQEVLASEIDGEEFIPVLKNGENKKVKGKNLSANILLKKGIAFIEEEGNDTTAILGNENKPFATISAALDAGVGVQFLTLMLGIGEFDAPIEAKLRSGLSIIGTKQPRFNTNVVVTGYDNYSQSPPTKLIEGSIIKGTLIFADKSHIQLENFGLDVGKEWVDNVNGGVDTDGIDICQNYTTSGGLDGYHPDQSSNPPTQNTIVKNIILLGDYSKNSYHGLLIETKMNSILDNITSACFTWNIVLKTINVLATNLNLIGAKGAGLYLKSSYYAHFTGANISNVNITSFTNTELGDGILISGEANISTVKNLNLNNININRCVNGIRFWQTTGSTVAELCNISNCIIRNNRGKGILMDIVVNNSNFSNIISANNTGNGVEINTGANNSLNGIKSINNNGVGFILSSTSRLDVCDIFSNGNAGGSINYGSNVFTMGVTSLSGAVTGTSTAR